MESPPEYVEWFEVPCSLCGISFDIERIRTVDEPRSSAWRGPDDGGFEYTDKLDSGGLNCAEGACFLVARSGNLAGNHDALLPLNTTKPPVAGYLVMDDDLDFEHVAGTPDCAHSHAYNGYRVTVEELRGCKTGQCLVRKADDDALDDGMAAEFEHHSKYFLTSLGTRARTLEPAYVTFNIPWQNGVNVINVAWPEDRNQGDDAHGIVFHPTCFDIFQRLSIQYFGRVDLDGLAGWHYEEVGPETLPFSFPHDKDVKKSFSQFRWEHINGLEYLATNPLLIPHLPRILKSAVREDLNFSAGMGAFSIGQVCSSLQEDSFFLLPQELKLEVISYLTSKDVAHLRLASRAFQQLPIYLWRRLLREEMPWLWELWDPAPPYRWATVHPEDCTKQFDDLDSFINLHLPIDRIDWYRLYTNITRNWNDLKGLRNRRRIWKAVEIVVQRIRRYREQGVITD